MVGFRRLPIFRLLLWYTLFVLRPFGRVSLRWHCSFLWPPFCSANSGLRRGIIGIFPTGPLKLTGLFNLLWRGWLVPPLKRGPFGGLAIIDPTTNIRTDRKICIPPCKKGFGMRTWVGYWIQNMTKPISKPFRTLPATQNFAGSIDFFFSPPFSGRPCVC